MQQLSTDFTYTHLALKQRKTNASISCNHVLRKKYLVTPFFVDQLSFNLTSCRHYRAEMAASRHYLALGWC
jgi:hypothetical protein